MSERRTVVTGAAGFIGRHAVRALRARGHDVLGVDNLCVTPLAAPEPATLIRDVAALRHADLDGASSVLHLAAWRSVPESFAHAARYQHNVAAVLHLVTLARECGVRRIVLASSCEVYGMSTTVPTSENAAIAPRSPYAMSKAAAEMLAGMHTWSDDIQITIARLFNVYGPAHQPDTVIAGWCQRIAAGEPITIDGSGHQRRDFSHVDCTVEKLVRLIEVAVAPSVVNIGSGASTSIAELASLFGQLEPAVRVQHHPDRPCEIAEFRADTRLAEATLGPVPDVPLEDGIRTTLAWWRARPRLTAPCSC